MNEREQIVSVPAGEIIDLETEIVQLEAENARLRAALEHYADGGHWNQRRLVYGVGRHEPFDEYVADPPDSNGYDVARAALAHGVGGTTGGERDG